MGLIIKTKHNFFSQKSFREIEKSFGSVGIFFLGSALGCMDGLFYLLPGRKLRQTVAMVFNPVNEFTAPSVNRAFPGKDVNAALSKISQKRFSVSLNDREEVVPYAP